MPTVHVIPLGDLIHHEETEDCICGPTSELVEGGRHDGWLVTHHSLDGRELREAKGEPWLTTAIERERPPT